MASLVPVALTALQAFQAVNTVATITGRGFDFFNNGDEERSAQALAQLKAQQNAQFRNTAEKAALDKQELSVQSEKVEAERRAALKRAVARQRAQFGSSGVGSGDGSSEAVLLGLFEESETEKANRERLDNLKLQSIDQGLANTARVNTLERTQLTEREKLKNYTSPFDKATEFYKIFS